MSVGWGVALPKMEVASCTGWDWVPMEQTCGLHGEGFPVETIILSIQEQSNCGGCHKHICISARRDDTIGIMEMYVLKAKLGRTSVEDGLGILAGAKTK